MQQSMLALGALVIITMLSINQQRASFLMLESMYLREIENAAADYATLRTEEILSQASYDESRVGSTQLDVDVNTLTESISLGPEVGENTVGQFDDLDDFHNFQEQVTHILSADTFRFDVSYDVSYINLANPTASSATPTLAKEFTILVQSRDSIGTRAARYAMSKTYILSDDL